MKTNNQSGIMVNPLFLIAIALFLLWLYFKDKKLVVSTTSNDANARVSSEKTTSFSGSSTHNGTGTATSFSVPHLLDEKPTFVQITPTSGDSGNYDYVTVDRQLITVFYKIAPPEGLNNVTFNWYATL